MTTVETTVYAQVVPTFGKRYDSKKGVMVDTVSALRIAATTVKRPSNPKGVVVKLTLRFNERVFMPLQPQAVIEIDDNMALLPDVIEVEAVDANDNGVAEYLAEQLRRN